MPAHDQLPDFGFVVECGGQRVGFSEVSGLTQENPATKYRDGALAEHSSVKMPGLRKFSNITLKRGVANSDDDFFKWLAGLKHNAGERRQLVISLLNEQRQPTMVWKVHNAFPVKVEAPNLNAGGNVVAIESIELTHEGLELQESKDV